VMENESLSGFVMALKRSMFNSEGEIAIAVDRKGGAASSMCRC
jgi:hypothetical protein